MSECDVLIDLLEIVHGAGHVLNGPGRGRGFVRTGVLRLVDDELVGAGSVLDPPGFLPNLRKMHLRLVDVAGFVEVMPGAARGHG